MVKSMKKLAINIDFDSFDTTISPQLLLVACDLMKQYINISDAPIDLYDKLVSNFIFTNYITYNPNTRIIETGKKKGAIGSGFGWTGISGYICANLV